MSALKAITEVTGTGVPIPGDDIDTDRIIPARYLKAITFDELGPHLFHDERWTETGEAKAHPLNDERYEGANILISGDNFGCGSSREHAPQSLVRHGIRAVIAGSFAGIFFGNSTKIGLVCVQVERASLERITRAVQQDPGARISIDLLQGRVTVGELQVPCQIPESARRALTGGYWDPIAQLLESGDQIDALAAQLGYRNATRPGSTG